MAQFSMNGIEDLMKELEDLADIEETAKKMVDEATPVLEETVRSEIKSAANRGYATGELANSVKKTKAKTNQYGVYAAVLVSGTDHKGVRNAEKLAYLEYGTSTQQAHPVMAKAVNKAEQECLSKMQQVFEREVGK